MPYFKRTVPETFSEELRLDKYIASVAENMNRSKLKSGVSEIIVNGKKAKLSTKVRAGDEIEIEWDESVPDDIIPEDIPLNIIYEDENVTVVNKKQGMVTHPANGNWTGTLVNALLFHWNMEAIPHNSSMTEKQILKSRRPGIVHRLDKDTSGVIITARNRDTEEFLSEQFRNHSSIEKIYICICSGHPKTKKGEIVTKIARDSGNRKKFKAFDKDYDGGKLAVTKYNCFACYGPFSLFFVKILTGRTHQIRVHLKHIGCPILGDSIYSKPQKSSVFKNATLMLHAYKLKIRTEKGGELKTFTAPVPVRFKKVLKTLHKKFNKSCIKE